MILPHAPWRDRPGLAALVEALGARDGDVRFVGGAVRDTLLGAAVSDVDCATSLPPEEVCRRIAAAGFKSVPTGIAHGTVTAILPDSLVEVTTLRRDVATDGRRATVSFTDDWREDAARRDFTINALSAEPLTGLIHDYFGGLSDLTAGVVRFIGDPMERIAEDRLRILRFFRFQARFGRGAPNAEALAACIERANDLMALSRERIADELLKMLALPDPVETVRLMVDHGVLTPVLPEIRSGGVDRLAELVGRETLCDGPDPIRRLVALLPSVPTVAQDVAMRLKLSNARRKRIALAASAEGIDMPVRQLAHWVGGIGAIDRLLLHGPDRAVVVRGCEALRHWVPPLLPIGGGELVRLGLKPGPMVAATLKAIERQWAAEDFPGEERVRKIAGEQVAQALRAIT
jgi:poly(A) polymerase